MNLMNRRIPGFRYVFGDSDHAEHVTGLTEISMARTDKICYTQ